jgi:hypothetical protein
MDAKLKKGQLFLQIAPRQSKKGAPMGWFAFVVAACRPVSGGA